MTEKRLYVVRVEIEFAALARNEREAREFTDEAIQDMSLLSDCASARVLSFHQSPGSDKKLPMKPEGWEDDALVYGAGDKDITLAEAIEMERKVQGHG